MYTMMFADAFHPSASYSTTEDTYNDDGNNNTNTTTTGINNNNDKESSSSQSGSNSQDQITTTTTTSQDNYDDTDSTLTCHANNDDKTSNDDNENENDNKSNDDKGTPHPEDDRLLLFHYKSTTSTQDEAKKVAKRLSSSTECSAAPPPAAFCVTATSQSNGRGTSGRQWLGAPGNVFVTIGVPMNTWMTTMLRERKIPLTLLPLKIGDLTASLIRSQLDDCGSSSSASANNNDAAAARTTRNSAKDAVVTVKWPNDILVDGKKISGTLIESSSDWFLIGIGINIAYAPTVPSTGTNYGRPSVSLNDYAGCRQSQSSGSAAEEHTQKARDVGVRLALDFHQWILQENNTDVYTAKSIVEGWKRWLDWDAELTMRNDGDDKNRNRRQRIVKIVDVLPDGRILVQDKDNSKQEVLVSDYFV